MAKRKRKKEDDIAKVIVPLTVLLVLLFWRHPTPLIMVIAVVVAIVIAGMAISTVVTNVPEHMAPKPRPVQFEPQDWSVELLRSLDWKRFEELCAAYFCASGYKATVTSLGADGGIDVMLYGKDDPNLNIGIVQCKAWTKKEVGVKEVREFLGVMTSIGCPLGIYVTIAGYTPDARAFSARNNIQLLGAEQLLDEISKLPRASQASLLEQTTAGDYTTPSCPSCGTKLVSKTKRSFANGDQIFWGCRNFPRCRHTMRAKSV